MCDDSYLSAFAYFYVYLRCWYTQAACEVSVQGSGYGVLEGRTGQEKAEKNGKQSVVKVDFREKVSQVRLQEIRRKYG